MSRRAALLTKLGLTPQDTGAARPNLLHLIPAGWGMRGSLRGSPSNGVTRTIVDYRAPHPIAVGTLQAIETDHGQGQVPGSPTQRFGTKGSAYNGRRNMGYFDPGLAYVGSAELLSAAAPARNLRQGLPATGPLPGQPLSQMSALLLQSDAYDTSPTGLLAALEPRGNT